MTSCLTAPRTARLRPMSAASAVFVSSTMDDLRNERRAVRNGLLEFNFEPVNAENLAPNGAVWWTRIGVELEECDVIILFLGDTCGWVPTSGPQAGSGKSVTHLEFERARELGLPVLGFIPRYFSAPTAKERRRREDFRRLIENWDTGVFRSEFDLADDLAEEPGRAMIELLSGHYPHRSRDARPLSLDQSAPRCGDSQRATPRGEGTSGSSSHRRLVVRAGREFHAGLPAARRSRGRQRCSWVVRRLVVLPHERIRLERRGLAPVEGDLVATVSELAAA